VVADLMAPPISLRLDQDLRTATQVMLAGDLRAVPVVDDAGALVGLLDGEDLAAVLTRARRATSHAG
jgi:CBS domain-containing protein